MNEVNKYSHGIVADRNRLYWNEFKQMPSPFPPQVEQQTIADFLDSHGRMVRHFLSAKRQLIKLINEQKQAIIHRAVTHGADSNVRLKPSGIDWLGDVPEHWKTQKLKYLVRNMNEQASSKAEDEIYIALEHIESWTGRLHLPEESVTFESQVKCFRPGDILFSKLRPYLAKVVRPAVRGVCVGELLVLRSTANIILPEYLEAKLRSKQIIDLVNSSTFGAKMPRADWAFIGNLIIAFPPIKEEQQQILHSIHLDTARFDNALENALYEIDLIHEYRTRLIANVVTGKIDVLGVALPSEEEAIAIEDWKEGEELQEEEMMDAKEATHANN